MRIPDTEDIRNLAQYILTDDREKDDFKEQVVLGDLEPGADATMYKLAGLPVGTPMNIIGGTIWAMDGERFEQFALEVGTNHAYPTALRVMAALNDVTTQEEGTIDETTTKAKEAYERHKK